jgi:predicted nucleic acid-binding Zn ribbon protein
MSRATPEPEDPAESGRTLLIGSRCRGCGRPLTRRQRACSAKCRAALSRRPQDEARRARDAEVRALLVTALESIEAARRRLGAP